MAEIEQVIRKVDEEFSKEKPGSIKEHLDVDPELYYDILSAFDTAIDEGGVDYKGNVKLNAQALFPADFNKLEFISCGAEDPVTRQRLVKLKTRLYYKQLKFNLLREEAEGYAKTIAELFAGDKHNDSGRTLSRLQKLIGQFNLDPNRVIDIILECFEANSDRASYYTALLSALKVNKNDLSDSLKRKFIFEEKVDGSVFSLCNLSAIICEQGLIDLIPFFTFLNPEQTAMMASQRKHNELVKSRARKAQVVVTTTVVEARLVEQDENAPQTDTKAAAAVPFHLAFEGQITEDQKLMGDFYNDDVTLAKNMKLGLLCALLERGSFDLGLKLLDKFPKFLPVHRSLRIRTALAKLINASISSLYASIYPPLDGAPSAVPEDSEQVLTVEPVASWNDFVNRTVPMVNELGPYVATNPITAFKLLRLISAFMKDLKTDINLESLKPAIIGILDSAVLPALSLLDGNHAYSDELWELLNTFDYKVRFRLYAHWRNIATPAFLEVQRATVLGRTKYSLKRLSKDTVKLIGRQIGKLSHIHPFAVFEYLLEQVQVFQNLIGPVVDSLRFLTPLELDVMTFCIIDSLASPEKGQLKAEDGTLSMWITALATLIGALYKKFSTDLTGMLQFIVNELKTGKSIDLLILREIISNMSGIDSNVALTENSLEALTGGDVLKQEVLHTATIRNLKRLSSRLRDALLKNDLLATLFILMPQQNNCVAFEDSQHLPLKLAGQLFDQCRETFIQFNNFIQFAFKPEELATLLPDAKTLVSEAYLPIVTVMHFWRENYMREIVSNWRKDLKKLQGGEETAILEDSQIQLAFNSAAKPTITYLEESFQPLYNADYWLDLTPRLFALFWLFDLGDLQVPTALYETLIAKAKSEQAHETSRKRPKEDKARKLKDELKSREEHVHRVASLLQHEADKLFSPIQNRSSQMLRFLQSCILPRAMFSESDAAYCAKFVEVLHRQKTPNLQSMLFFDKIFCDSVYILNGLSETESHAIGKFYQLMLELSLRWHDSSRVFDDECVGFPMLLKVKKTEEGEIKETVGFDEYRSICFKWHFRLTKSFNHLMKEGSYVSKRNALIVMTKILTAFPIVDIHVNSLRKTAETLKDAEKNVRNDLSLQAATYITQLMRKKSATLKPDEFYTKEKAKVEKAPPSKTPEAPVRPSRKRITTTEDSEASSPKKAAPSSRSSKR
uniref:THO complex subunit 2 n=1 Tax=Panagrellus redivivus TaxID=6233 RepID=A0A7E4VCR3_PANRE